MAEEDDAPEPQADLYAVNAQGEKLSKQTYAPPIDPRRPLPALIAALAFLGQRPPQELGQRDLQSVWKWAITNWRLPNVPRVVSAPVPRR